MSFLDDLGKAIEEGARQVAPDVTSEVARRLREQIQGPTVVNAPQPEATLTVAQSQRAMPANFGFYVLIAAATVGAYLLLKRGKK